MVGNHAAYAASPPGRAIAEPCQRSTPRVEHTRVHSIRTGQRDETNQHDDFTSGDSADEGTGQRNGYSRCKKEGYGSGSGVDGGDDDDEEDEDEEEELLERERNLQREREEMKARFTFQELKRRNLKNGMMDAMRRKRRMLMRNENLRFRELYKPPEPQVVVTVIALVAIVTLILTKSWPFY